MLNIAAACSEAYLGLAMAEAQSRDREAFRQKYIEAHAELRLNGNGNHTRARQFSKALDEWFSALDKEGASADVMAGAAAREAEKNARLAALKTIKETGLLLSPIREKIAPPMKMTAAGNSHTVGLQADGTVAAALLEENTECDVSSWTDVVTIASGGFNTVGLRADSTVVAVGSNDAGQCEVGKRTDIVAVAAGYDPAAASSSVLHTSIFLPSSSIRSSAALSQP